jgi:hypothetical protein
LFPCISNTTALQADPKIRYTPLMPLRGHRRRSEFLGQGLLLPPARNIHLQTDTKIDLKNLDHVMSPMYLQILFVDGGATA